MKNQFFVSVSLAILIAGLATAAVLPAADMSGTWVGNMQFSSDEDDVLTLVLTKSGSDYKGIINDSLNLLKKNTPLTGLKTDDKTISFSFVLSFDTGDQTADMVLTPDGEKLAGTIAARAKGGAGEEIVFIRKK